MMCDGWLDSVDGKLLGRTGQAGAILTGDIGSRGTHEWRGAFQFQYN